MAENNTESSTEPIGSDQTLRPGVASEYAFWTRIGDSIVAATYGDKDSMPDGAKLYRCLDGGSEVWTGERWTTVDNSWQDRPQWRKAHGIDPSIPWGEAVRIAVGFPYPAEGSIPPEIRAGSIEWTPRSIAFADTLRTSPWRGESDASEPGDLDVECFDARLDLWCVSVYQADLSWERVSNVERAPVGALPQRDPGTREWFWFGAPSHPRFDLEELASVASTVVRLLSRVEGLEESVRCLLRGNLKLDDLTEIVELGFAKVETAIAGLVGLEAEDEPSDDKAGKSVEWRPGANPEPTSNRPGLDQGIANAWLEREEPL